MGRGAGIGWTVLVLLALAGGAPPGPTLGVGLLGYALILVPGLARSRPGHRAAPGPPPGKGQLYCLLIGECEARGARAEADGYRLAASHDRALTPEARDWFAADLKRRRMAFR